MQILQYRQQVQILPINGKKMELAWLTGDLLQEQPPLT
ncbi:hypothetical protein ES705_31287 [subsurface metagenome]